MTDAPPVPDLPDVSEAAFLEAEREVHALPQRPPIPMLLRLYGLYMQASEGDVQGERPGGFDFAGAAKYDAWAAHRGQAAAPMRAAYVQLVGQLVGRLKSQA